MICEPEVKSLKWRKDRMIGHSPLQPEEQRGKGVKHKRGPVKNSHPT